MSCYHPLVGFPSGAVNQETGKQKLVIRKEYLKNHTLEDVNKNNGILIPCGHCIGCRLDYSRKWADRMMLEMETEKKGIFLTLTYDDEHCPWSQFDEEGYPIFGTLVKKDFQDFMKRFRKELAKKDLKCRFYASGEYGERFLRPHYHAIIFGIGLDDISDIKFYKRNNIGQNYYKSEKIREIWHNGAICISNVSYETCAYVARYVMKKLSGEMKLSYAERNVIPEFSLMSRKPGIGAHYLEEHPECLDLTNINLSTPEGGRKIQIPEYYLHKLELQDKEKYDKIKEQRKKFASDKVLIELLETDLGFVEYLEQKEEERKSKIKVLRRKG